jgi:hypothetical protein
MRYKAIREALESEMSLYLIKSGLAVNQFTEHYFDLTGTINGNLCSVYFERYIRKDGIEYAGGLLSIQYRQVEEMVFPLILKYHLWDSAEAPKHYAYSFGDHETGEVARTQRGLLRSVHISDEVSAVKYSNVLQSYLEGYAIPWFDKYSKLEAVNELINSLSMQDILNWFAAPFPSNFYRAMVIAN